MDENEVVKKAQNGDTEAIEYIFKKYKGYVLGQTKKYYINIGDMQDVFQEASIGLWIAIKSYKFNLGVPFGAFANICIKNKLLELVRNNNRKKHAILNNAIYLNNFEILMTNKSLEEKLINKETINGVLEGLTKLEYDVAMLTMYGFSVKEISNRMSRSERNIRNIKLRIRKKYQKYQNGQLKKKHH